MGLDTVSIASFTLPPEPCRMPLASWGKGEPPIHGKSWRARFCGSRRLPPESAGSGKVRKAVGTDAEKQQPHGMQ